MRYNAILLAGWFLFLPPRMMKKGYEVDLDKPISKWEHAMSFDTAKECEDYRQRMTTAFDERAKNEKTTKNEYIAERWVFSRCIPSDSIQFK